MMVVFDTPSDSVKSGKKSSETMKKSPTGKLNYFNAPIVTEHTTGSEKLSRIETRSTAYEAPSTRMPESMLPEVPPVPLAKPPAIPKIGISVTPEVSSANKFPGPKLSATSKTQPGSLPKLRMATSTPNFEVKRRPSVSDLLSRLTQPNQSSVNRLHEINRDSSTRNVSSPLTSTNSTFPSFSAAKPKTPPLRTTSPNGNLPATKPLTNSSSTNKSNNTKPVAISSPNNIVSAKSAALRSNPSHTASTSKRSGSTSSTESVTKPSSPRKKTATPRDLPISRPIAVVDLSNARPAIKEPAQVVTRKAPPLPASVAPPTPRMPDNTEDESASPRLTESPIPSEEPMDFLTPKKNHQRRPSLPAPFLNIKTRFATNEIRHKNSYSRPGAEKPLPPPPSSATSSTFPDSPALSDSVQAEIDDMKARNKQLRKMLNDALSELDQANVELAIVRASRDALQHQVHGYKQALEKPVKYQYMLQDDEFARNECLRFDLNSDTSTDAFVYSGAWNTNGARYNAIANSPPSSDSSDSDSPLNGKLPRQR